MSQIKQPQTKKGQETRKKILATAEEIFGEKGYFETSVVDITQRAGVAQGTFYKYFPTKKDIYDELVYQLSRDLRLYIKEHMDRSEDFETTQRQGYLAFFKWVKNHQNLYSVIQQAVLVDPEIYRWYYEKLAAGFIKALEDAMEKGECRRLDSETIAFCLMGIGQFIGMRWILWDDKEVPEQVFEDAMEFAFRGINLTQ
ncbi:TetR/AcrR family transcriptional regulator [Aquisalibacillus elongatus]|uniref:TetR family transcriptional regulator n=1 Tax=Aquisalibacillus elongatus TaxID=485577 RepID=A0A3N5B4W7_9BACI|nr:TetR/AcrR family transcriptional regulator [Aquisalibacillus elongatus]RPF50600.1 TetR family transcriptional regulator [Aquisalibacillus elongatus]